MNDCFGGPVYPQARIAKERAKQQRASRKEAGDLPGQVAAAEVEAMAAEEEAARDAADAEEERRAAAEAARAEARWAVELERTAPGASDRLARGLEEWCSSQVRVGEPCQISSVARAENISNTATVSPSRIALVLN